MVSKLLLQDVFYLTLEDGTGDLLLEQHIVASDVVTVTSTVIEPTVQLSLRLISLPVRVNASAVEPTTTLGALSATVTDAILLTATAIAPDVLTGNILTPDVIIVSAVVSPVSVRGATITLTPDIISVTTALSEVFIDATTGLRCDTIQSLAIVVSPDLSLSTVTLTAPVVTATNKVITATVMSDSGAMIPVDDAIEVMVTVVSPTVLTALSLVVPVITVQAAVTTPNLNIGSVVYQLHPRGRQQIVVDQQQGGILYPFGQIPSDNLPLLIGDIYLNYNDNSCEYALPFSIKRLNGFGTESVDTIPAMPHPYGAVIVDNNDVVVFNTDDATSFKKSDWQDADGVYLRVLEWINTSTKEILRIVTYIAWPSEAEAVDWPFSFEPEAAILDVRTLERITPSVTQLSIVNSLDEPELDDVVPAGKNVVFKSGYNSALTNATGEEELVTALGGLQTKIIRIDLHPGLGLGKYPCVPELFVKRIRGVEPNNRGNISVDATDCYRFERPIDVLNRTQANVTKATLKLSNDCGPCCDCQDFINVYEAIRRLVELYKTIGKRAAAVRDQLKANNERWNSSLKCRSDDNIQTAAEAFAGCKVAFGVGVCNSTDTPMLNLRLKVSFEYGPDENDVSAVSPVRGCVVCNTTTRRGNTVPGAESLGKRVTAYTLEGDWPNYEIVFDCISPGTLGTVNWVMQFSGCTDSDVAEFVVQGGKKLIKTQVALRRTETAECCVASEESSLSSSSSEESL